MTRFKQTYKTHIELKICACLWSIRTKKLSIVKMAGDESDRYVNNVKTD